MSFFRKFIFFIYLLFFFFPLQKKSTGAQLMEQVYYHLDLIEKDYFGLQFTDPYNVPHWLDPTKPVKKQVKSECNEKKLRSPPPLIK